MFEPNNDTNLIYETNGDTGVFQVLSLPCDPLRFPFSTNGAGEYARESSLPLPKCFSRVRNVLRAIGSVDTESDVKFLCVVDQCGI